MNKSAFSISHGDFKQMFLKRWKAIVHGWEQFFFSPMDLYPVGLFRMILGLTLIGMYVIRATHFDFFYLSDGVLPVEFAKKIMPPGFASLVPLYFESDLAMKIHGFAHLFLLVLFTLGLIGRNLTWLLFLLNVGLMQRNMSIVYGADLFGNLWLFYLCFVQHNRHFTLWNWLRKGKNPINLPEPTLDLFSSMGIRLVQIQLCISYAYTGIEKLKGSQWWEGSAVWNVIGMEELIPHNFTFMVNFPNTLAFMTMATVIFEIYFIFAVWQKPLRKPWLLTGVFFHLSTALFMDLWFFCLVMISSYILFVQPKSLRFFEENIKRFLKRKPSQADIMVGMS